MSTPFEPGAPPPKNVIPLCVPEVRGNEWKYIKDCLDTNFVSSVGPYVDKFEQMVASYVGTRHAVATVNGTAALQVALMVAGVQPNDEVLVSTLTFIAPANAVRYVGAWPVFIDADPTFWQMDPVKVAEFVRTECHWNNGELRNKVTGRRVRAIIPVHILGHPVDMDPILALGREFNLAIIEDATESLGTEYKGRKTGGLGSIGCFSFNGNKLITTGGGGMIVTNNEAWAKKAKYLTTQAKDDPLEYVHNAIGFNHRLTNVLAAMGCAQLEKVDEFVTAKRRIAARYTEAIKNIPGLSAMKEALWARSAFWMFTILVDPTIYRGDSRQLLRRLASQNVQTRPLWQPMHQSPAHRGSPIRSCKVAEAIHRDALSLPCSVGLNTSDQEKVIGLLSAAVNGE